MEKTADGGVVRCSRMERPELFRHVVGGYGLFGVVTAATLRLVPRRQVERIVQLIDLIYGTIRLIEPDAESALPWAHQRYACVIFNLHVDHAPRSIVNARAVFTRLIDHAGDDEEREIVRAEHAAILRDSAGGNRTGLEKIAAPGVATRRRRQQKPRFLLPENV